MATINLTTNDFKRRVADLEATAGEWKFLGDKPAVIDFFATWCGPCKALSPVLEEISAEYAGKVDIYKVDIDKEEPLLEMFDIRSVPTLIFVPMKGSPERATGVMAKDRLRELLDELIKK